MITEKDLQEAIAECEGQRNPNANTCIKLAAFYTIRNEMFPHVRGDGYYDEIPSGYSHGADSVEKVLYDSGTDFSDVIMGMDVADFIPVMDELMESVRLVMPRLYESVLAKLKELK